MKRKASKVNDERPSKIVKESTTDNLSEALNTMLRTRSVRQPSLKPVKLPSLRKKRIAARRSASIYKAALTATGSITAAPFLRKRSTVKIQEPPEEEEEKEEEEEAPSVTAEASSSQKARSLSKKESSSSQKAKSLSKKESSSSQKSKSLSKKESSHSAGTSSSS